MGVCCLLCWLAVAAVAFPPCSALHDTRSKLLADVFYGSPGSTSLVENVQTENFQLEEMDLKGER